MEPVKKALFSTLLLGIAVAALSYIFIFHVQGRGVKAKDGWLFDLPGYYQALQRSSLSDKPVLLYLRRKACQRCIDFERNFLNNPVIQRDLSGYITVQINIDTDRKHRQFAKQFNLYTYPSIFVFYDKKHPVSTHLVLEIDQIWVAIKEIGKGNFMPLSEASFRLALERATMLAKQAADKGEGSSVTLPTPPES